MKNCLGKPALASSLLRGLVFRPEANVSGRIRRYNLSLRSLDFNTVQVLETK